MVKFEEMTASVEVKLQDYESIEDLSDPDDEVTLAPSSRDRYVRVTGRVPALCSWLSIVAGMFNDKIIEEYIPQFEFEQGE